MPSRSARALSSIRAAMTNQPSVSRGLCGGVFLKSRASCLSLSVFIGLQFDYLAGYQHRRAFVLHEGRHLRALEEKCSATLLRRDTHHLGLTEQGQRLL